VNAREKNIRSQREHLFRQGRRFRPKEGSREVGAFGIRFV